MAGSLWTVPACGAELVAWRRAPDNEPGARRPGCCCAAAPAARRARRAAPVPDAHEAGAYGVAGPLRAGRASPRRCCAAFDRRRLRAARSRPGAAARRRRRARAASSPTRGRTASRTRRASSPRRAPRRRTSSAGALEDASFGDLGAITLWHVLEHVEDPAAALRRLHGWLRPGGTLLVGVAGPRLAGRRALAARAGTTSTCRATARTSPRAGWGCCWSGRASASSRRRAAARAQPVRPVAVRRLSDDPDAVVALPRAQAQRAAACRRCGAHRARRFRCSPLAVRRAASRARWRSGPTVQ